MVDAGGDRNIISAAACTGECRRDAGYAILQRAGNRDISRAGYGKGSAKTGSADARDDDLGNIRRYRETDETVDVFERHAVVGTDFGYGDISGAESAGLFRRNADFDRRPVYGRIACGGINGIDSRLTFGDQTFEIAGGSTCTAIEREVAHGIVAADHLYLIAFCPKRDTIVNRSLGPLAFTYDSLRCVPGIDNTILFFTG